MSDLFDIAIVGGGAAGLSAAILAAQTAREAGLTRRSAILDGAKSLGAKVLVSGGGRCNVTHDEVSPDDFNGSRNIVRNILARFDVPATIAWFESMGVRLKRERTGKLFPVSDSAKTVLNALLRRCEDLGISMLTEHRVSDVTPGPPFTIVHSRGEIQANRVILATGGRSLPKTGSDGLGWEIARRLGHSVTDTYPALVPLVLEDSFFHASISGLSCEVELSTFARAKLIDRRRGSLLWTHFGVSGPVVMDASRHWAIAHATGGRAEMRCSLFPGRSLQQVEAIFVDAAEHLPRESIGGIISEHLPYRLAEAIIAFAGLDAQLECGQLPRDERRRLALALIDLKLPVLRDRGWNYAEVTAGGVPLAEINYRTMESRKVPGLYLVGEMLDCDGRIGGFNFQWAWATGYVAGRAAAAL